VIFRNSHLACRDEHAAAFHVADLADFEIEPGARNVRAGPREYTHHAGARIGRTAYDLYGSPVAGLDQADL